MVILSFYLRTSCFVEFGDALLHETLVEQEGNVRAAGTSHCLAEASKAKRLGHDLGAKHPVLVEQGRQTYKGPMMGIPDHA